MSQLLTDRSGSAAERIDRCAEGAVIIRPAVVEEEQGLILTAVVRSVRSSGNLNRIRLAVAFDKDSADSQVRHILTTTKFLYTSKLMDLIEINSIP